MPENNAKSVMLLPGNKATYSHATAQIQVKEQVSANELAWQTGGLAFVNTPLHLVITDLQQYFSVKIVLKNTALRNCPFTAPITNQSVEKVLEGLALVFDMKLENPEQGAFILAGGSCK
jgi:ferric-dicitrate binding protein FerR (iron transport regulator)